MRSLDPTDTGNTAVGTLASPFAAAAVVVVGSRGEMSIASIESRSNLSDLGQSGRGRIEFEDTRSVAQSDVVANELSSCRSATETGRH